MPSPMASPFFAMPPTSNLVHTFLLELFLKNQFMYYKDTIIVPDPVYSA